MGEDVDIKSRIKNILDTRFNLELMTIDQLSQYYTLYEKVSKECNCNCKKTVKKGGE